MFSALQVRGDLELILDETIYPTRDSGAFLEISYDIPYTSLTFLKAKGGFEARFSIGLQLLNRHGNPLAGDLWEKGVFVSEYEPTVARDSTILGRVVLAVPDGVRKGRVEIEDLASDRKADAVFVVERPSAGLRMRFLKHGQPNPGRTYELGDTVDVLAELLTQNNDVESCRFLIKDGRRVVTGRTAAVTDSSGRSVVEFSYPIADSSGVVKLGNGEYRLEVAGLGKKGLHAQADFRVKVPFFYDDDAYQEKVAELLYIATSSEMSFLKNLSPNERGQGWHRFWEKKDMTPTTEQNEKEEEYFERIEYAKKHFSHGDKGYRSDRARVYIRYGPADHIDSRPFEIDSEAYEIWHYYSLGLEFFFVDRYGFGEYVMEKPRFWNER